MPRLLGVDIPANKKLEYSLRYVYGIGPTRAKTIVAEAGFDPDRRAGDLSEEELNKLPLEEKQRFLKKEEINIITRIYI